MAGTPLQISRLGAALRRIFRNQQNHRDFLEILLGHAEQVSTCFFVDCLEQDQTHLSATPPEECDLVARHVEQNPTWAGRASQ
jgi:hypothetical protein